jgi:zinc/manganese transport system substrate-binding protein
VVVTVDQWGDLVRDLAGDCGHVTSIVTGSSGDPHDYDPTPADVAAIARAKLLVRNGVDYDPWATRAFAASESHAAIVDAGAVAGAREGDNPHLWYSPTTVAAVADATTRAFTALAPSAADYFRARRSAWDAASAPYRAAVDRLRSASSGRRYAATEPVFDLMAAAVGLTNATPPAYQAAANNESDPGPAAVADFSALVRRRQIDVLVFNPQTSSALTAQLRHDAEQAAVPVVEITETVKPGAPGFVAWQVTQLDAMTAALEGP